MSGLGHNRPVMRRGILALLLGLGLLACTGRTPPGVVVGVEGGSSSVVDAGRADTGPTLADTGVGDELYTACSQLADCPPGSVRCTVERAGVCNPTCNADGTCPEIGGKAGICVGDGSLEWCVLPCGEDFDCPEAFVCSNGGTCVRR